MDSHGNNTDWESIQFREGLREWGELKESIFTEEVSLEGWSGREKSLEKSMEVFHRLNSKTEKPDPRSRPSHRALQSHAKFCLYPIGHKKTRWLFSKRQDQKIAPVAPQGRCTRQMYHSGLEKKQEGDYSKSPGLTSCREPSLNPQPSGTINCP